MDAVAAAIWSPDRSGATPTYTEDEFQNIKEMVYSAADKWLGRDLVTLTIVNIEQEGRLYAGTTNEVKGYIDLEVTVNEGDNIAPFNQYGGASMVIDWKTRGGELDQRWRERLIDSWQWRLYAAMIGAQLVSYRGVSAACEFTGSDTKEIIIKVGDTNAVEVGEYIAGQTNMLASLNGFTVYPRNMPWACNKGNVECPFKTDCDNYTMPRFEPTPKVMSYTEFERFSHCPEYYRRSRQESGQSAAASLGQGFHRAMECLYRQAQTIKL